VVSRWALPQISSFFCFSLQSSDLFFAAEKLPQGCSGSQSIDKWFSSGNDIKSVSKPEVTKTSEGIWGDFESDSVPDAVLLTAASAMEQQEIKTECSQNTDAELHFPGYGQKLGEALNRPTSASPSSIVRRIPGVGIISGRSVVGDSKPLARPFPEPSPNAAASDVSKRQSLSHLDNKRPDRPFTKPLLNATAADVSKHQAVSRLSSTGLTRGSAGGNSMTASSSSPVKFESVAEFRKTIGMAMSPSGTEVRVKNFVSVCNPDGRRPLKPNNPLGAPRLRSELSSVSDDDDKMALKKMRFDAEATSSNFAAGSSSKTSASSSRPNDLMLQLDRSMSIHGDDGIIVVNSDSESDVKSNHQAVGEDLNAYQSETRPTAPGILSSEALVDEAGPAETDQAVGGMDTGQVFQQTGYVACPVCQISVAADRINDHLDQCLM